MSLSSMPTGTISGGGSGSRTYPPDGTEPAYRPSEADTARRPTDTTTSRRSTDDTGSRQSTDAPQRRDVESLRRENEALRRANVHLRDKLDSVHRDRQEIVDHYERLMNEFEREGAVGTSPRGHTAETQSSETRSVNERVSAAVRPVASRLAERVLRSVGLR